MRIVFSKDRALQLHAFLRSYAAHVTPAQPITVLYLASTDRHERAYQQVFALCPWAQPHRQSESFHDDLLGLLPGHGSVILFADDHLFLRSWDVDGLAPLNLHLGLNLTHCYTQNVPQPLPPDYGLVYPDKLTWRWGAGLLDWGYPLALCGQVFEASEFRRMVSCVSFHSPNSLEAALQVFAPSFYDRMGLCYRESKLVLLPWNLVQQDCANRCAAGPSVDELLTRWEDGWQINVACLYGWLNTSLHQELPLVLQAR